MQQLVKRLEIIKAAISLEDEETIALHRSRLNSMSTKAGELRTILTSIDALDYPAALTQISSFLNQHVAMAVHIEPEVAALKMELQGLERRLAEVSAERDEILRVLDGFNRLYKVRLGGTISAILKLHMLRARAVMDCCEGSREDQARIRDAHEQAQSFYQEFNGDYEVCLTEARPKELSEDEALRLKNAYRKASRLCHPDMVAEELKDLATTQFQALNQAYNLNDVDKVEELLTLFETGGVFVAASEQVQDKERLRSHISSLRQQLNSLGNEIKTIKADMTWTLVDGLNGAYEDYFSEQEELLNAELESLRQEYRELIQAAKDTTGVNECARP